LVTGKNYLGTTVNGLRSLTWSCEENRDEIWRNQAAINAHFGLTMADLMGLHIVPRRGEENTLLCHVYGVPTLTPLYETLREQVNDLKADVLVLDNIAQVYGGALNDPHQVTMFVNALVGLVTDRPFAPVLLGHVAKSPGSEFSGSAAWENAVRMRWYLGPTLPDQKQGDEPADNPDVVYLARRKANFTGKDWLRLKFQAGVLVPDMPQGGRFDQAYRDDAADRVVLSAMTKLSAMGITATDGKTSPDYLPKQVLAKKLGENHTREELTSAMNRLMANGQLKRAVIGQYANRANRYGLVAP
jgi:RecA-family ATPase